jgi:hypothetical protein
MYDNILKTLLSPVPYFVVLWWLRDYRIQDKCLSSGLKVLLCALPSEFVVGKILQAIKC